MKIINFIVFQAGWVACVLGAAHGYAAIGPLVVVAACTWHVVRAGQPVGELAILGTALVIGAILETGLARAGLITYPTSALMFAGVPAWLLALWPLFASTLNVSLRWMHGRWGIAAVAGAIGGPLAYWSGERLGALSLAHPDVLFALAAAWGVVTPALVAIARHFDGYAPDAHRGMGNGSA